MKIDWCVEDKSIAGNPEKVTQPGNMEASYPPSNWETVGSHVSSGTPGGSWMTKMEREGATVVAYAGNNMWFALKEKEL